MFSFTKYRISFQKPELKNKAIYFTAIDFYCVTDEASIYQVSNTIPIFLGIWQGLSPVSKTFLLGIALY